jgi:hypothetical protein
MIHECQNTLEANIDILIKYIPLLSDNGILIIEGIKDINWCNALIDNVPTNYKIYVKTYDMREVNNCHDEVLFVINKNI